MDQTAPENTNLAKISQQIAQNNLPPALLERLQNQLARLQKAASSGFSADLDKELDYLNFVSTLPFAKFSQDILDLHRAAEILDKNHYGLKTAKDRILEYLSVLILNSRGGGKPKAQTLSFVGLVGSGKTSLAYSIAEALGRQIVRIPFGGLGSVKELRGESRIRAEAEPGLLMKAIHSLGVANPVVLLDEVDRVAVEARSDVMGVLVELLDPEQNYAFLDHFVDFPFDLSRVLFIATANNTGNIATAVLDRMEVIEMPSYTDEEKVVIGKNYLLPKALKGAGLPPGILTFDDNAWPQIVRPLGFDAGVRSLSRTIEGVVRKVARGVVEGNNGPYRINPENIGQYIN